MNETPKDPEEEATEREAWEKSLTASSLPAWWKPEEAGQPAAQQPQPQPAPQPAPPQPAAQALAPPAPSAQPAPAPPAQVTGAPPDWQHSVTAGELPAWWKPGDPAPSPPPPAPPGPPPALPTAGDPAATVQMPHPVGGPALPAPAPAPARALADPEQRTMVLGTFPAAPPQAQLTVRSGPDAGTTFSLGAEIAYLGRAKDNQLIVNDPATSRRHARFEVRDRRFILVDLGSANGSAIDGVRVVLEQPLTDGCTIAIGQNEIVVAIR